MYRFQSLLGIIFLKGDYIRKSWIVKILINRKDRTSIQNAKKKHYFKIT